MSAVCWLLLLVVSGTSADWDCKDTVTFCCNAGCDCRDYVLGTYTYIEDSSCERTGEYKGEGGKYLNQWSSGRWGVSEDRCGSNYYIYSREYNLDCPSEASDWYDYGSHGYGCYTLQLSTDCPEPPTTTPTSTPTPTPTPTTKWQYLGFLGLLIPLSLAIWCGWSWYKKASEKRPTRAPPAPRPPHTPTPIAPPAHSSPSTSFSTPPAAPNPGVTQKYISNYRATSVEERIASVSGSGNNELNTDNVDNHVYEEINEDYYLTPNQVAVQSSACLKCKAIYDYKPDTIGGLSFQSGDLINIHHKHEDGWWEGESKGKVGFFPATYVESL